MHALGAVDLEEETTLTDLTALCILTLPRMHKISPTFLTGVLMNSSSPQVPRSQAPFRLGSERIFTIQHTGMGKDDAFTLLVISSTILKCVEIARLQSCRHFPWDTWCRGSHLVPGSAFPPYSSHYGPSIIPRLSWQRAGIAPIAPRESLQLLRYDFGRLGARKHLESTGLTTPDAQYSLLGHAPYDLHKLFDHDHLASSLPVHLSELMVQLDNILLPGNVIPVLGEDCLVLSYVVGTIRIFAPFAYSYILFHSGRVVRCVGFCRSDHEVSCIWFEDNIHSQQHTTFRQRPVSAQGKQDIGIPL